MAPLRLENVAKRYPNGVDAVAGIDIEVSDGECLVLVGPSGCGKSTLLRMIAGLETLTGGRIWIGERDVTRVAPKDRDIAMIFQSYALYAHMTVRDNLGFGLKMRRMPKSQVAARVEQTAQTLGLDSLLDRKPAALSGGQRQRVAMGRAIVREPVLFLMDEPLSNLDAKLRGTMRSELARLHERLGVTTVYVTHDQTEAMTLGDRVAVLLDGRLQQLDTPTELFARPKNLFVASFIGSPPMNLAHAEIVAGQIHFGSYRIPLPQDAPSHEGPVILGIRPTDMALARNDFEHAAAIEVTVDLIERLGAEILLEFPVDVPRVVTDGAQATTNDGDDHQLLVDDSRARFVTQLRGDVQVTVGRPLEVYLNTARLHLFDPATGAALGRS
jgi:multiple sugar transport system ATP-binding protein